MSRTESRADQATASALDRGGGNGSARLFLALWPDPATRAHLTACRDAWSWNVEAAPVHSVRLHLTLHFIGGVPQTRVAAVADALAVNGLPFEIEFGHFRSWSKGLAVLCPEAVPDRLVQLHGALADALRGLGLPVESRTFQPHVTLARKATGAKWPPCVPGFSWPVAGYALMESVPGADYCLVRPYSLVQASDRPAPSDSCT